MNSSPWRRCVYMFSVFYVIIQRVFYKGVCDYSDMKSNGFNEREHVYFLFFVIFTCLRLLFVSMKLGFIPFISLVDWARVHDFQFRQMYVNNVLAVVDLVIKRHTVYLMRNVLCRLTNVTHSRYIVVADLTTTTWPEDIRACMKLKEETHEKQKRRIWGEDSILCANVLHF